MKISAFVLKLKRGLVSILRMIKGQNSVNNVGGIKVLCIFSYNTVFLYTDNENAFNNFKVV